MNLWLRRITSRRLAPLLLAAFAAGCAKNPQGLLGRYVQPLHGIINCPGEKYCSDYSLVPVQRAQRVPAFSNLVEDALSLLSVSASRAPWACPRLRAPASE